MKTITIDKNSWHYRLLDKLDFYVAPDICSYTRKVLGALFLVGLMACFSLYILGALTNIAIWLVVCLQHSVWFQPEPWALGTTIAVLGFVFIIGIVLGAVWIAETNTKRKIRRRNNNEPDGFVTEAYKSFKDKVCYRVDFK